MKVIIQGNHPRVENLTDRHYMTEGGEGKVYGKGNLVYKIWHDPKKANVAKLQDYSTLNRPNILKPEDILYNENKVPIGFTMRWIKDTAPICKLFTNDFRSRFNVTPQMTMELIERMITDIEQIHLHDFLMVDGNEFNYLVDMKTLMTPYFIDVDSWQTPNYPATAIMPSIRDWNAREFSTLTDWFSFAIIATQLLLGIHPYKGKHKDYKKSDMEGRMRANISIFNKGVGLPKVVRDFSLIPENYKKWLYAVLEEGKRLPPPSIAGALQIITAKVIHTIGAFIVDMVEEWDNTIVKHDSGYTFTHSGIHKGSHTISNLDPSYDVVFCKNNMHPIFVGIRGTELDLVNAQTNREIDCNINATDKVIVNNILIVKNDDNLIEIEIDYINGKYIALTKAVWKVLPASTHMFNGFVYQDVLGVPYFMIPFKNNKNVTSCMISSIQELKGYKILEGKHELGVLIVIAFKDNKYDKFIFRFNSNYTSYVIRKVEDISMHVPNFVTMDNGIVVAITEDEEVEIFNSDPDSMSVKQIKDPGISGDMKLCKYNGKVGYRKDNQLFTLTMKK